MIPSTFLVSLAGTPAVRYGFWYFTGSNSANFGRPMLTLNTFWSTVFISALSGLGAWSFSRLWRIVCAIIFSVVYNPQPTWEESQNTALIVNNKAALDGFFDASGLLIGRQKHTGVTQTAKSTLIAVVVAAFSIFGLAVSYPFLVALIPVANYGLVVSKECGTIPAGHDVVDSFSFLWSAKKASSANAAFLVLDGSEIGVASNSTSHSKLLSDLPEVSTSYIDRCPDNVPACSSDHPFTFTSEYTLSSQHFALNFDTPFSLRVSNKCYRPILTKRTLSKDYGYTLFGLFYGPVNSSTEITDYTESSYIERMLSPGYTLTQYTANVDETIFWAPNSTLIQGGDTTILFYYVGGVGMLEPSTDPIFVTQNTPLPQASYLALDVVAPVVCDTKYVLCTGEGRDCSDSGGMKNVISYLEGKEGDSWIDLGLFFGAVLGSSPIYQASLGSNAVAAATTTMGGGRLQLKSANVTAQRELTRLATAGMLLLAGSPQLLAMGYWDVGNGTTGLLNIDDSSSLCSKVIVESANARTIPVIPYAILLAISLLFVSLSYAHNLPLDKVLYRWDDRRGAWALYSAGQLHREVMEKIRGRFQTVDTSAAWPTAEALHQGPAVITLHQPPRDRKYFGSGIFKGLPPNYSRQPNDSELEHLIPDRIPPASS